MALENVLLFVGGVGGAKLALGMARVLPPHALTIIVNNGDDFWHYGLRVCPDTDTLLYTLAGRVDTANGWGLAGDTTTTLEALRVLGEAPWFGLKDRDLATHLVRTDRLRQGHTLTEITAHLAVVQGVNCRVLPMSDQFVETKVQTAEYGWLDFQEYFVRYRFQPTITGLQYAGAEQASLTLQVAQAVAQADAIIFAPSNPWLSIAPILSVPGLRASLVARAVPRVAVTPLIAGQAVKGPTAKLMAELGYAVTPTSVAAFYGDAINAFVWDERDTPDTVSGLHTTAFDTLMNDDHAKVRTAQAVLAFCEQLR